MKCDKLLNFYFIKFKKKSPGLFLGICKFAIIHNINKTETNSEITQIYL